MLVVDLRISPLNGCRLRGFDDLGLEGADGGWVGELEGIPGGVDQEKRRTVCSIRSFLQTFSK